ncbi:MAG TPA: sugar transferase [Phycisphaerae bacterium]|nr:sugar transferase [Phycisphaerae bacterium]HRR84520.1 sugar transferase [Phycisphaerae bacterium]
MYPFLKRAVDILVSLVLIVLFSPVILAAALAVKLSSPGPVFFVQPRGGRFGRPFMSIKFRTMRADHVHDVHEVVPLTHPNITRLGRFMRRFKIDELPQLFNILRGDMSLVGPRPTIMEQVVAYNDFQRRRLDVRPGLTGLAQVNATAAMSWEERIKYDVYYVDHCGPLLDLLILAKTPVVVLLGEERFARPFEQSPYARKQRYSTQDNPAQNDSCNIRS